MGLEVFSACLVAVLTAPGFGAKQRSFAWAGRGWGCRRALRLAATCFQGRLQDLQGAGVGCSALLSISLPVSRDRLDPKKKQP